ncbi:MAG: sulfite exporter TauE/SafE family protein [Hyphomicrobiaceae bacterium]|nr:sulfite exporter TauE/SafE family protein [Hyphomicrobiaceae bacterium]
MDFSLPVVFGAGILSFLSPCVLPLVPPYLTYMSGASFEQYRQEGSVGGAVWRRSVFTSVFFILGFSLVFIALGATATAFGQAFRSLFGYEVTLGPLSFSLLPTAAGILIVIMGLHFLGLFRIGLLDMQVRHQGPSAASGPLGGFLLGLAFAIGWTPCIGPVLAAILAVAANQNSATEGALLLAVYSLGLGVPFFIAGVAIGPFLGFFQAFKKHLGIVEKAMGALLVLTGLLFVTGQFTRLSYWFLETFPALSQVG